MKATSTKHVAVAMDKTARDPSGGCGKVKAVMVVPDVLTVTEKDVTLTFIMSDAAGSRFTDFRFFNTTLRNEGWYKPRTGAPAADSCRPPGIKVGFMFEDLHISPDGQTLTVLDKNSDDALYLYLLEWKDAEGNIWVSDPKIKNQP